MRLARARRAMEEEAKLEGQAGGEQLGRRSSQEGLDFLVDTREQPVFIEDQAREVGGDGLVGAAALPHLLPAVPSLKAQDPLLLLAECLLRALEHLHHYGQSCVQRVEYVQIDVLLCHQLVVPARLLHLALGVVHHRHEARAAIGRTVHEPVRALHRP